MELDGVLGGGAVHHRECQDHESPLFLSYFKERGLEYLDGGVDTGFTTVGGTQARALAHWRTRPLAHLSLLSH